MTDHNEFGQPVGDVVEGWTAAKWPGVSALDGRLVRLEPLEQRHGHDLYTALAAAPPGHWTYMPWGPFVTSDDYAAWVDSVVAADGVSFMAICRPSGEPLGVAGYLAIDPEMGSVEVGGITFAPVLQATIEATEAMYLMMSHAFDDLGYRRYEWKCDSLNGPSRSAAERLGFVFEGTFAQHRVVRGRNRDTAWFSITDDRWTEFVGPALRAWLAPDNFDEDGRQRRGLSDLRSALAR